MVTINQSATLVFIRTVLSDSLLQHFAVLDQNQSLAVSPIPCTHTDIFLTHTHALTSTHIFYHEDHLSTGEEGGIRRNPLALLALIPLTRVRALTQILLLLLSLNMVPFP